MKSDVEKLAYWAVVRAANNVVEQLSTEEAFMDLTAEENKAVAELKSALTALRPFTPEIPK